MSIINLVKHGKIEVIKVAQLRYRFIEPPIIQLSPRRTGSTLLFNALIVCFPKKQTIKCHCLTKYDYFTYKHSPKIMSMRNPLDSICSLAQIYKQIFSDEIKLRKALRNYKKVVNNIIKNKANIKILKYERFIFNFDYLFSKLEIFLNQPIAENLKQKFIKEYTIDKALMKAQKLGNSFAKYDPVNHFHGKHISKYRGANGYYKKMMTQEQISLVYSELKEIFALFEYQKPL